MTMLRFDRAVARVRALSGAPRAAATAAAAPPPPPAAPDAASVRLEGIVRDVARGIADLRARLDSLGGELEREAVALALAAAERVLGEELEQGRARLETLLRPAIAEMMSRRGGGRVVVRLHPEDLEALRGRSGETVDALVAAVELRADPATPRHSARVETAEGSAEVGVRVAMHRLRDELLGSAG